MISVIIPLFNKQDYINRAIKSVLNQTFQSFELIVIDDGSKDQSALRVKEFYDDKLRYYYKNNGGESSARNLGIKYAKYQYVCFLDADDEWLPNHLENINSIILKYKECNVIATNYFISVDGEKRIAHSFKKNKDFIIENYFRTSLKRLPIMTSDTVAIKKNVIDTVGLFDENLSQGPDLDYWFRISLQFKIVFSSIPTAIYYHYPENRVINVNSGFNEIFIQKLICNISNINSNNFALKYIREVFYREIRLHLKFGNKALVRQILRKFRAPLKLAPLSCIYFMISLFPTKTLTKIRDTIHNYTN